MERFNYCPVPDYSTNTKPNVDVVQFGDGYQQRQSKGLNPVLDTFAVKFAFSNKKDKQKIEDCIHFLKAHKSTYAFLWFDPSQNKDVVIRCTDFSKTYNRYVTEITCNFEEVIDGVGLDGKPHETVEQSLHKRLQKAIKELNEMEKELEEYLNKTNIRLGAMDNKLKEIDGIKASIKQLGTGLDGKASKDELKTGLDGTVKKTGDTMTGGLTLQALNVRTHGDYAAIALWNKNDNHWLWEMAGEDSYFVNRNKNKINTAQYIFPKDVKGAQILAVRSDLTDFVGKNTTNLGKTGAIPTKELKTLKDLYDLPVGARVMCSGAMPLLPQISEYAYFEKINNRNSTDTDCLLHVHEFYGGRMWIVGISGATLNVTGVLTNSNGIIKLNGSVSSIEKMNDLLNGYYSVTLTKEDASTTFQWGHLVVTSSSDEEQQGGVWRTYMYHTTNNVIYYATSVNGAKISKDSFRAIMTDRSMTDNYKTIISKPAPFTQKGANDLFVELDTRIKKLEAK